MLACARETERRATNGERDIRIVIILDTRLAVGAVGTERSSSRVVKAALTGSRIRLRCLGVFASPSPSDATVVVVLFAPGRFVFFVGVVFALLRLIVMSKNALSIVLEGNQHEPRNLSKHTLRKKIEQVRQRAG